MKFKKIVISLTALAMCMSMTACSSDLTNDMLSAVQSNLGEQIEEFANDNNSNANSESNHSSTSTANVSVDLNSIPEFDNNPYVELNGNKPDFSESDKTTKSFEEYSPLDQLGRCGVAYANVGQDLMPTEKRGPIGMVKPSGWHTIKYDIVDGNYLYNRCHLIGYQLTAENANTSNLITGTRYLNVDGMLPFENEVAEYVKNTNNHVLYRVTPIYTDDNLVANGVQMEALSVEDDGKGVSFNVYCYNAQPGVDIDYATGESKLISDKSDSSKNKGQTYIINTKSMKFHLPSCSTLSGKDKSKNTKRFTGLRDDLLDRGYSPCGSCNP